MVFAVQHGERSSHMGKQRPARPYFALATGSLAFVLGTVNVTVSNVAFPEIVRSFPGVSTGMTGWIIAGYSLAFATTMLAGGRLADRYGRLRIFRIGLFGLLLGALGAGLAPNPLILVLARALQGMFGALTVPSSLALVLPQTSQRDRALGRSWNVCFWPITRFRCIRFGNQFLALGVFGARPDHWLGSAWRQILLERNR
jgi:MFS family permease